MRHERGAHSAGYVLTRTTGWEDEAIDEERTSEEFDVVEMYDNRLEDSERNDKLGLARTRVSDSFCVGHLALSNLSLWASKPIESESSEICISLGPNVASLRAQ
jgi:hypothetical protein